MLVTGTSGVVHPAARLPFAAAEHGAVIIEVNPEVTPISSVYAVSRRAWRRAAARWTYARATTEKSEREGVGGDEAS
jgi:NAD-dependent SIR2 family protein deacetylase